MMSLPMFYAPEEGIDLSGGSVTISGEEARHISKSLRVRVGERISVGDGAGIRLDARVTAVTRGRVEARIETVQNIQRESPLLVLFQALTRTSEMDRVVSRAAEVGMAAVVPFTGPRFDHGETAAASRRLERWRRIALEASKVARRAWVLEVKDPVERLDGDELSRCDLNLVMWEMEEKAGLADVLPRHAPGSIGIIVGPHGGFSRTEVDEFLRQGALTITLGDMVLRSESAGLYAAILIRHHYGLLGRSGGKRVGRADVQNNHPGLPG